MNKIDKNIANNLRKIRRGKNMSLDMLAEQTGVSKSMLGQIERGESNPTVATISKIVEGLRISFEDLIYEKEEMVLLPEWNQMPLFKDREGEYELHTMLPFEQHREIEIYEGIISARSFMVGGSHGDRTWEYLMILQGEIEVSIGEEKRRVNAHNSLYFASDRNHTYYNHTDTDALIKIIIFEKGGAN